MTHPSNRPQARQATPTAMSGQPRGKAQPEPTPSNSAEQLGRDQGDEQQQTAGGYTSQEQRGPSELSGLVRSIARQSLEWHAMALVEILGITREQVNEVMAEIGGGSPQDNR